MSVKRKVTVPERAPTATACHALILIAMASEGTEVVVRLRAAWNLVTTVFGALWCSGPSMSAKSTSSADG
jgi:hypothetical protein